MNAKQCDSCKNHYAPYGGGWGEFKRFVWDWADSRWERVDLCKDCFESLKLIASRERKP